MTEDDARDWIASSFGSAAFARIEQFAKRLEDENARQNLVSRSAFASLWCRHIVDSAQLVALAPASGSWIDIGTGGGFPGLIVAALRGERLTLVEPRRKRAEFLAEVSVALKMSHVTVRQCRIAVLESAPAKVISARAVASIDMLLRDSRHVANRDTLFIFPRGRSGADEVSAARRAWRGVFHVKQSITDPDAAIIVAKDVRAT